MRARKQAAADEVAAVASAREAGTLTREELRERFLRYTLAKFGLLGEGKIAGAANAPGAASATSTRGAASATSYASSTGGVSGSDGSDLATPTRDLETLAEASLARMLHTDPAQAKAMQQSPTCDGASSTDMKQALLLMTAQREFGVRASGRALGMADTTDDVADALAEAWGI